MSEDIQKLEEYVKMGSNLPKEEFVAAFKNVVRTGNAEEVQQAYAIITSLSSNPDLLLFSKQGIEEYKKIQKSHIGIDMLYSKIQNFQNNPSDISQIAGAYAKITDAYFLRQANNLLNTRPELLEHIQIRKTKKEIEEEKETLKDEFLSYQQRCSYAFDSLNKYLSGSSYSTENSKKMTEELEYIEVLTKKYKDILGTEKYAQVINQIGEAKNEMQTIINDIEEEQKMWSL